MYQVSKRVAEMVLENHPAYATELQKVMELQQALQNASIVCANGRRLGLFGNRNHVNDEITRIIW